MNEENWTVYYSTQVSWSWDGKSAARCRFMNCFDNEKNNCWIFLAVYDSCDLPDRITTNFAVVRSNTTRTDTYLARVNSLTVNIGVLKTRIIVLFCRTCEMETALKNSSWLNKRDSFFFNKSLLKFWSTRSVHELLYFTRDENHIGISNLETTSSTVSQFQNHYV